MIKKFFVIAICTLSSCTQVQKEKEKEIQNQKQSKETISQENSNNGIWQLNDYFNNILADKAIAKHRIQPPSWSAILIKIHNDSLFTFGSIMDLKEKINRSTDTLALIDVLGVPYALTLKNNTLLLKQVPSHEQKDTVTYSYSKHDDLKFLIEHKDSFYNMFDDKKERLYGISKSITRFFNEKLIAGTYLKNKTSVVFGKDGSLQNFDDYDKYEVRNYFGTLHPHKNLDVITLKNSKKNTYKQFHWKFEKDKLILTDFIEETITQNGKKVVTDYFVPGKNRIELMIKY